MDRRRAPGVARQTSQSRPVVSWREEVNSWSLAEARRHVATHRVCRHHNTRDLAAFHVTLHRHYSTVLILHRVSKNLAKLFCHNFVKFPPTLTQKVLVVSYRIVDLIMNVNENSIELYDIRQIYFLVIFNGHCSYTGSLE